MTGNGITAAALAMLVTQTVWLVDKRSGAIEGLPFNMYRSMSTAQADRYIPRPTAGEARELADAIVRKGK